MSTAIDQGRYREVLGHFASGVTVVAALTQDGPLGFTCQSFSALSLDPALVMISPAKTSSSWSRMQRMSKRQLLLLLPLQEGRNLKAWAITLQ
ncbi:MAG: flavin reductase family protein [Actinobacteria bacterium]|nr:flavin reductase family protein [Actinomycetota bacterium]